ncbi:hypothetical protein BM221_009301 [Beauveria bassiana]|uniref:Uncharacterized protein n=1 Tax=Beauveria bassiana TaxID=176275 RepID=A0A2N6NCW2_BEABA|nr:hypothetical protein BM221_009301 [Beauveria bassiana]
MAIRLALDSIHNMPTEIGEKLEAMPAAATRASRRRAVEQLWQLLSYEFLDGARGNLWDQVDGGLCPARDGDAADCAIGLDLRVGKLGSAVADLDNAVWISGEAVQSAISTTTNVESGEAFLVIPEASGLTVEEIDEIVEGSCFNAYQTIRRQQVIKGRNYTEASMLGKTM